jgi:hypothetical protein
MPSKQCKNCFFSKQKNSDLFCYNQHQPTYCQQVFWHQKCTGFMSAAEVEANIKRLVYPVKKMFQVLDGYLADENGSCYEVIE